MTDTTPHRATAEQWDALASLTGVYPGAWGDCILELRARVEALEASATCPHVVSSDEGTSYCRLAEQQAAESAPQEPAPDGLTVDTVADAGEALYVLCDDGTIWERDYRVLSFPSGWRLHKPIPQCPVEEADQ